MPYLEKFWREENLAKIGDLGLFSFIANFNKIKIDFFKNSQESKKLVNTYS